MTYNWTTPIRYVRGLGPTRSRELTKIGITTVGDLLERAPNSYIFPGTTNIADASEGNVVIKARVTWIGQFPGRPVVGATLSDGTSMCKAQWYGGYAARHLHKGMTATFYGKMKGGTLQQPKWTTVERTMENVYGGQYGEAHHDTIRAALVEVLAHVELPRMYNGDSRIGTFKLFHFPPDSRLQQAALLDLKQDESICLALALAARRRGREGVKGEVIEI